MSVRGVVEQRVAREEQVGKERPEFVPDGKFLNNQGHEELVRFAEDWFTRYEGGSRHWNSQHLFTPTATGARGSAYLYLWDVRTTPPSTILTGVYDDELVRTADGWRFRTRVLEIDRAAQPGGGGN